MPRSARIGGNRIPDPDTVTRHDAISDGRGHQSAQQIPRSSLRRSRSRRPEPARRLARVGHPTSCCGTLTLRNAGNDAGRRQGSAIQQFMMRLSSKLRRYRWAVFVGVAAPPAAVGVPRPEPVGQSHRRRIRGRRLAVAERRARHPGPLPGPGRVPAGAGRRAARRRLVRRHDRARSAQLERIAAEVPSVKVDAQPAAAAAAARPALRRHPADGLQQRQLRRRQAAAQEGRHQRRPAGSDRRTARSSSTSSGRARSAPRRARPPSTTSPRPRSGTCRSS